MEDKGEAWELDWFGILCCHFHWCVLNEFYNFSFFLVTPSVKRDNNTYCLL